MIGLAHGSRHPGGRAAIEALLAVVSRTGDVPAQPAYLDLADPDLQAAAGALAAAGQRRAVVVPLLFTSAFHATVDVPQAVRRAAENTGLELVVADIVGTSTDVVALLEASLATAGVGADASVLVLAVGSSNPAANAAVVALADELAATGHASVRAAFATCDPRPADVVPDLPEPVAVLPLFLADGLLLDPVRRLAAERGWTMIEPLGERAAGVVLDRYRAALDRF